MLLVILRPPVVRCDEKRTMQHIRGWILFGIFTIESGTKVWRMIMRLRDAIK